MTRRHYAILGVLTEHGTLTIDAVAQLLHRSPTPVAFDLGLMEERGRIVSQWQYANGLPSCLEYRVATDVERRTRRAIENQPETRWARWDLSPTHRAERRRFAIVGVLAERGPLPASSIAAPLHLPSGTIWPDLAALEADGRIISEWEKPGFSDLFFDPALTPDLPPRPRRRLYRLTTDDERDRRCRIRREIDQEITDRVAARHPSRRRIPILRPRWGAT